MHAVVRPQRLNQQQSNDSVHGLHPSPKTCGYSLRGAAQRLGAARLDGTPCDLVNVACRKICLLILQLQLILTNIPRIHSAGFFFVGGLSAFPRLLLLLPRPSSYPPSPSAVCSSVLAPPSTCVPAAVLVPPAAPVLQRFLSDCTRPPYTSASSLVIPPAPFVPLLRAPASCFRQPSSPPFPLPTLDPLIWVRHRILMLRVCRSCSRIIYGSSAQNKLIAFATSISPRPCRNIALTGSSVLGTK